MDEDRVKKHENQIKDLNKRHQIELEERQKKHKNEIAKRNMKFQEELKAARDNTKEYKKIIDKFRKKVKNPNSKIFQVYDFTDEYEIKDFISWFRVLHKKVKNQTVKRILVKRFEDNPEDAELFKKMVEEYNSTLLPDTVDENENEEEK